VDVDGAWAATGTADAALLARLLDEPYFAARAPKSTGRDLFNAAWLDDALVRHGRAVAANDVQATLVELTARTVSDALARDASEVTEVLVCGGGGRNMALMAALERAIPSRRLASTATLGVATDQVEALAFAWLAREALAGRPGNLPTVTGARGPRVLGAIYPR
jgi:anhydro-N-acetylmuramic acid kinase